MSVVVDTDDSESASVILAIVEVNPRARVIVLIRDTDLERYLEYAGADTVLTPRHLLGRRIAERIEAEVRPRRSDSLSIGDGFGVVELTFPEDSPVCGDTLADSGLLDYPDVVVSALWKDGEFVLRPSHETVLRSHTNVLATGDEESLREMERFVYAEAKSETKGRFVVAGFGEVGSTVIENPRFADTECVVVDIENGEGVDFVGDATKEEVLCEAGIEDATAFVSTVQDDDVAILLVLVARELVPDLDIIARVNDSKNENESRRAGADYVLSLPDISGSMLASEVLREEVLSYDRRMKIVRVSGAKYAGKELADTGLAETEGVVVAVEHDGDIVIDVDSDFVFEEGDEVLFVGAGDVMREVVASEAAH